MLYLLQLVQSLKFESSASDARSSRSVTSAISYDDSGLADFLVTRAVQNRVLGYRLYWYLTVEVALEDRQMGRMYGKVIFEFLKQVEEVRRHFSDRQNRVQRSSCSLRTVLDVKNFLDARQSL
jgi:phosphatidylinositol 3-kinase